MSLLSIDDIEWKFIEDNMWIKKGVLFLRVLSNTELNTRQQNDHNT